MPSGCWVASHVMLLATDAGTQPFVSPGCVELSRSMFDMLQPIQLNTWMSIGGTNGGNHEIDVGWIGSTCSGPSVAPVLIVALCTETGGRHTTEASQAFASE